MAPAAMAPAAVAPAAVAPAVGVAVAVVGAGAAEAGNTAPETAEGERESFAVPQYSWSIAAAAAAVDTAPGDFAVAEAVYYGGQEVVRTELPASR